MKRVLLALLGLILLAILAYFCFQNKADYIRDNLISSTNTALSANNITGVTADLKGNDLEMTDIMKLTGEVPSLELKAKAETLARAVAGVGGVDNQLTIEQQVAVTTLPLEKELVQTPEAPVAVADKAQKIDPYTMTIVKDEENKVSLNGYVDSSERQNLLVAYAQELFGSENVTDDLKVASGAPEDWEHISSFALDCLKDVDYGNMKLSNQSYEFTGHLPSPSIKEKFLDGIRSVMSDPENKYSRYRGDYIITAPVEEPKGIVKKEAAKKALTPKVKPVEAQISIEACQKSLDSLLANKKVLFDLNKASISKNSYTLLNSVHKNMKECHVSHLEIAGHTDASGSAAYNQRLSDLRSESIKRYFVKKGFSKNKLSAIGYGESKPIASNSSREGRAKNRRIEFIVKGVEK